MQVTMSMEEYEDLTFKNAKIIEELEEKYRNGLTEIKNGLMLEIKILKLQLENKNIGCKYCNGSEETIMYTSDDNSIYIGEGGTYKYHNDNSGYICLINSDSYKGNEVKINYCPMCGKKLEV